MTTENPPAASLQVQREDLGAIETDWRELLPRCRLRYPFYSPAWLRVWWEEFGAGRDLMLLSVRQDGRLAGVAPLMREGGRISFAGDTAICDYMDIVAAEGDEPAVLRAVLQSLAGEPWDELVLWGLHARSPTLEALPDVCRAMGWPADIETEDVCPQLDLPTTWEEYMSLLDKADRHELRRKLRKLPQGGPVDLQFLRSPEEVEAAFPDFVRMHVESRIEKAEFMTDRMASFFRRMARVLAADGLIEMQFLRLGGRRVAGVLAFRGDGEVLLYNSGYDTAYAGLSVGLLSKVMLLERAIDDHRCRFDFLRGAEPYKYDLGAKDVSVYRAVVRRGAGEGRSS